VARVVVILIKAIIAVALAGFLVVQIGAAIVARISLDENAPGSVVWVYGMLGSYVIAAVLCLQVVGVCIWRLLTRVRKGMVFSPTSFREVNIVIGAIAIAAVLTASLAVGFAIANRTTDGDVIAPGQVGLLVGLAVVAGGVALVVYVMRLLLTQAIALDVNARELRAELDEVI
jgi:hypothetical protein